jgi:hypothetical protein
MNRTDFCKKLRQLEFAALKIERTDQSRDLTDFYLNVEIYSRIYKELVNELYPPEQRSDFNPTEDKKLGWYGVDFDRTLAVWKPGYGFDQLGEPIPLMIEEVKRLLAQGEQIKIFTARADDDQYIIDKIQDWTERIFGIRFEVTNKKDRHCKGIYDDLAIAVNPNIGEMFKWK